MATEVLADKNYFNILCIAFAVARMIMIKFSSSFSGRFAGGKQCESLSKTFTANCWGSKLRAVMFKHRI